MLCFGWGKKENKRNPFNTKDHKGKNKGAQVKKALCVP
jgi:hypothetical protein